MFSQMNGYFPKKKGNLAVAALSTLSLLMVNNRAEAQTNILYIMTDQQNLDMIQALQLGSANTRIPRIWIVWSNQGTLLHAIMWPAHCLFLRDSLC